MKIELTRVNEAYLQEFAKLYPGDANEVLLQCFTSLRSRYESHRIYRQIQPGGKPADEKA